MCLIVDKNIHTVAKNNIFKRMFGAPYGVMHANVAQENILTEKILYVSKVGDEEIYVAPFRRDFTYELGKVYHIDNWKSEHIICTSGAGVSINEGFHSIVDVNMNINRWDTRTKRVRCKCVIPNGSLYFMGVNNDIVSDTFMVTEILESRDGDYANQKRTHTVNNNGHSNKKKRKRRAKMR